MSARPGSSTTPPASAWRHRLAPYQSQATAWWGERTQRERLLLRLGLLAVLAALLWNVALRPALDSISQSNERLPRLRTELAQIQAIVLEVQGLERRQSGRIQAAAIPDALAATVQRAGLADAATIRSSTHIPASAAPGSTSGNVATAGISSSPQPDTSGPEQWRVDLDDASAARVMEWLADIPFQLHLRIDTAELSRSRIDGRDRPGRVSGHVLLSPALQDPR